MSSIEEFYEALEEYNVINPILTFQGDYTLNDYKQIYYDMNHDMYYLNSKVDKGVNLFEKFLDKYFYCAFDKDKFDDQSYSLLFPILFNSMNKDGKGRHLEFNYSLCLINYCEQKEQLAELINDPIEAISFIKNHFRTERNKLIRYQRDRNSCEDYIDIAKRFVSSLGLSKEDLETQEKAKAILATLSDEQLDSARQHFTNIMLNLGYLSDYLKKGQKDIPEEAFRSCFDVDTFHLLYAKSIIDHLKGLDTSERPMDTSFIIVSQYLSFIKYAELTQYNPSIVIYDENRDKIVRYCLNDLKSEYETLVSKHPDITNIGKISAKTVNKLNLARDSEAYQRLQEITRNQDDNEAILSAWDPIQSGTQEVIRSRSVRNEKYNYGTEKKVVDDDEMLGRLIAFQKTNFELKLVGIDKFSGYIGYMYKNGVVVFEKFKEADGSIAQSNATYVMNLKNFARLSRCTKPEIMEYIKNNNNPDVRRLYHTCNWENNLNKCINGVEETEQSITEVTLFKENIKTKGSR